MGIAVVNENLSGIMMLFFLAGFWQWLKNNIWLASLFFALAFSTKFHVLIAILGVFAGTPKKSMLPYLMYFVIMVIGINLPILWNNGFTNLLESIKLFSQVFEFNGGIYQIFKWLGYKITGYNTIAFNGKLLLLIFCVVYSILLIKSFKSSKNLLIYTCLAWSCYLFLATTVHPWYVIPILVIGLLKNLKFPIVWSFLVVGSYLAYKPGYVSENIWVVLGLYLLLFGFIFWEFTQKQQNRVSYQHTTQKQSVK